MLAQATPSALEVSIRNGQPPPKKLSTFELALCGATAGVVSRFAIAPLDVVKIRFQLQTDRVEPLSGLRDLMRTNSLADSGAGSRKYRGMVHAFRTILRDEGIHGLWKGNMSAEYLYLTYGAVQFSTYAELERQVNHLDWRLGGDVIPLPVRTFICGALAGSLATIVTYPFDLLRTRFAVQGEQKLYRSVPGAIRHILAREGISGFYRGVWPSALSIMPYMGIMFESHRWFKTAFEPLNDIHQLHGISEVMAGFCAGVVSKAAVMPFDVVRKRLQVQGPDRHNYMMSNLPKYPPTWIGCARVIASQEGILGLYKGLTPAIVKAGPSAAVTFFIFGACKSWLEARHDAVATA
ncbi:hypothetical protein SmJEL517_g01096 [Synchytrium microbalum]|uniref:Mitochondrial thiamine pyrophosphate carrier 1 n=1 Tax=Synchytrium microbalum TaxID=1806994 RepID=A0A507CBT6_9FUNG|nr:uncharacterized protein SmJEL517_g01096 [Synchytrium microbalum]TPX37082.1 hypothetical protein SmJEL517_g01096 [Synchytrium microbalum]